MVKWVKQQYHFQRVRLLLQKRILSRDASSTFPSGSWKVWYLAMKWLHNLHKMCYILTFIFKGFRNLLYWQKKMMLHIAHLTICLGREFWSWGMNVFSATLPTFSLCLASLLCVYLLHTKRRSLWWWQQWARYREDQKMDRRGSRSGVTSRLASRTLGTMWGRQRPSINITLSSLSAIRDTCKWETL